MIGIDQQNVVLELESVEPIFKELAKEIIREQFFEPAVKELQYEFENHVVTKELDAGSEIGNAAGNPSNTLVGKSDKTLFTFIGFNKGEKPTNAIRNRIKETSPTGPKLISLPVIKKSFVYQFELDAPDLEDIYYNTPLPWAPGLSWAEKLEQGIPGLGRFVAREGAGRSGGGFQAKQDFRAEEDSSSRRVDYLSEIVRNFINTLNNN